MDATVGLGGHAAAILEANPAVRLVGIDWDGQALVRAQERLRAYGPRAVCLRGNFAQLPELLNTLRLTCVEGLLVDLGVSSLQLDDPLRGFSFQRSGPLDMRMDQRLPTTAAALLRLMSPQALTTLLRRYGEEPYAGRIARAICEARCRGDLQDTQALAHLIMRVVPRHGARIHPATRTFQALRMAVNDELAQLEQLVAIGPPRLAPGGRFVCVAFHSLEDRVVKQAFRRYAMEQQDYEVVTKKPLRPTVAEVRSNPRARSARLRILQRRMGGAA